MTPLNFQASVMLAQLIVTAGVWLYVYISNRSRATKAQIDDLDVRLTVVETRQHDGPSREALHELALSTEKMGGELKALCVRVEGMGKAMERVETVIDRQEEHLLGRGKG